MSDQRARTLLELNHRQEVEARRKLAGQTPLTGRQENRIAGSPGNRGRRTARNDN